MKVQQDIDHCQLIKIGINVMKHGSPNLDLDLGPREDMLFFQQFEKR